MGGIVNNLSPPSEKKPVSTKEAPFDRVNQDFAKHSAEGNATGKLTIPQSQMDAYQKLRLENQARLQNMTVEELQRHWEKIDDGELG